MANLFSISFKAADNVHIVRVADAEMQIDDKFLRWHAATL
jgi:hypothetical protein